MPKPTKTLTILARDPARDSADPDGDADMTPDDQLDAHERDADIAKVVRVMRNRDKTNHVFLRASATQIVAQMLEKAADFDLIQLIGHGNVGELWFGKLWSSPNAKLNYLLDSSPSTYGDFEQLRADATVIIFGCEVGAAVSQSSIADGPTLVFDLARRFKCRVMAPAEEVGAHSLDPASGVVLKYLTDDIGSFTWAHNTTVHEGVVAKPASIKTASAERVEVKDSSRMPSDSSVARDLSNADWIEIEDPGIIAAPSLVMKVRRNGREFDGELLANGRLLRLSEPGSARPKSYTYLQIAG